MDGEGGGEGLNPLLGYSRWAFPKLARDGDAD